VEIAVMRCTITSGIVLATVWFASIVDAAEPSTAAKYTATITLDGVQISAGPSWQYPHTGKLRQGEQIQIHHEDNGWYAILPLPGSVSWINHRFLGEFDRDSKVKQNAVVMKDKTEVRYGGLNTDAGPLGAKSVSLPAGTIVKVIAAKQRFEESFWFPIEPPVGEFRFVPKTAVSQLQPINPPVEVAKTNSDVAAVPTKGSTAAQLVSLPTNGPKIEHSLWPKAEQLHRSGDFAGAEQLYTQIYSDLKAKKADIEIMLTCLNRIDDCRAALRSRGGPAPSIPATSNGSNRNLSPPMLGSPTGALASGGSSARRDIPTSNNRDRGERIPPVNFDEPVKNDRNNSGRSESTGPGYLRKAVGMFDDKNGNQQIFALEDYRTQKLLYYVIADSGVDLETVKNRRVELFGTIQTRGEFRGAKFMIVSKVETIR
jgi:hypothetical protein